MYVRAQSLQSCSTLCDPMDCSWPGSSFRGILQQEHWSGLPCLPPGDLPVLVIEPSIRPCVSCFAGRLFPIESPGKPIEMYGSIFNSIPCVSCSRFPTANANWKSYEEKNSEELMRHPIQIDTLQCNHNHACFNIFELLFSSTYFSSVQLLSCF